MLQTGSQAPKNSGLIQYFNLTKRTAECSYSTSHKTTTNLITQFTSSPLSLKMKKPVFIQNQNYTAIHSFRGATTFSKLGVQFLGLGYYYPSTEKNRQVYPVWCSRLHNHTLFIKKLCKSWGSIQILGRYGPPSSCVHAFFVCLWLSRQIQIK